MKIFSFSKLILTLTKCRLPAVIHQDDKKYSATLYKKMRVEKCGGDFCDYEMLEKNT